MRWKNRERSRNVEDRRAMSGRKMTLGGLLGAGVLLVVFMLMGGDPKQMLQLLAENPPRVQQQQAGAPQPDDETANFVAVVLRDTEDVWRNQFQNMGKPYREPKLVLFRDAVRSACGFQSAASGPFYCPLDEKVYIDLSFFEQLKAQHGAPGDFAQAYVIAHEVGHHIQKLMGIDEKVRALKRRAGRRKTNELTVRQELQADFFAGVWAHHAQKNWRILEPGDIKEALGAASAIGDDRLQRETQGYIVPESFTHGTSEQRVRWFAKGLKTGDMTQGNTFDIPYNAL